MIKTKRKNNSHLIKPISMKRILLLILMFSTGIFSRAQTYNNEWIDYSKTYYKFKVGSTGLYRISQASLSSIGLGSTPAENFQLWRNGKEIPLFTTQETGPLSGSDFIEFWGEKNDGKPDNQLFFFSPFCVKLLQYHRKQNKSLLPHRLH